MTREDVFGFRREVLDSLGSFQGFSQQVEKYLPQILDPKNNGFRERAAAEKDPSFKQIIPYVVITDGEKILHYVRGKKSGEQRLISKGSIGIGGHINGSDQSWFETPMQSYLLAVEREVREEINVQGTIDTEIIGLINDDSTEVGSVHFGIVHLLRRDSSQVAKKEAIITETEFLSVSELMKRKDKLENWSQLCLEPISKLLSTPVA